MPAADSMPASWPRHRRDHRPVAEARRCARSAASSKSHRRRHRLGGHRERRCRRDPSAPSRGARRRQASPRGARDGLRARVEPGGRRATGSRWCRWGARRRGRTSRAAPRCGPACSRPAPSSRRSASGRGGPPSGSCRRGWRSPVKSNRQRPCGQIAAATATGTSRSTRSRPCSTCSSTNVPTSCEQVVVAGLRRRQRVLEGDAVAVGERRAPGPRIIAPVASRDPRQARPKREPSSSTNTPTPIGRLGVNPRSRSTSMAANDDTTPSGPSYAPPSSTESRCEPVSRASPVAAPAGRHQATTLP